MIKLALVTDSSAYLPKPYLEQYSIHVLPLTLVLEENTYLDGVDIQPEIFYQRLANSRSFPSTAQATPLAFYQLFCHLLDQGYAVLTILLSSMFSGTITAACKAKDMLPGAPVEIVDSMTTSMALGYQVLLAARAAARGANLAECKALVEQARHKTGVFFAVETLEYLHRGGRIHGGLHWIGTALNIKPIFEIHDGRAEVVEKVRTHKKALTRLLDLVEQRTTGRRPLYLATIHVNAMSQALEIMAKADERFHPIEHIMTEVSPVVGAHVGPGGIGLAFMAGFE
jgi:DegV family protein with EDD domain